jgi:dipeptidyl-peptidase 4
MTYPGGKHSLSTPAMRRHVYTLIANYFDEKVKRTEGGMQRHPSNH